MYQQSGLGVATGAILMGAAFLAASMYEPASPATDLVTRCCFAHPHHSGLCAVVPEEEQTCAGILDYLNDPMSTGKSYCSNTDIRGGWEEVPCEGTPLHAGRER